MTTEKDNLLFELWETARNRPWYALSRAAELIQTSGSDRPALLEAKRRALNCIIDDLKEHGDANRADYGGLADIYFTEELERVEKEWASLSPLEFRRSCYDQLMRRFAERNESESIEAMERDALADLMPKSPSKPRKKFGE